MIIISAKKNTMLVFSHLKNRIIEIVKILKSVDHNFSFNTILANELDHYRTHLSEGLFGLLEGTIINRDIAKEARAELIKQSIDHRMIGKLLNEHKIFLRDVLGISTFNINRIIDAAIEAGAYGAKIDGSGADGCMAVYAPESPKKVKAFFEAEQGKAFIISADFESNKELMENVN